MPTTIHATLQVHHSKNIIAVQFANDKELNRRFRQLPGARWSSTLKSWYVPDTVAYRKKFGLDGDALVMKVTSALARQPAAQQNQLTVTKPSVPTGKTERLLPVG